MDRKPGDLILVYVEDKPSFYGRIEKIEPDVKAGWYQVLFLFLGIPARHVKWILRDEYIDGAPFTMGGTPLRLELVPPYEETEEEAYETDNVIVPPKDASGTPSKVIPFRPKRK